MYLYINGVDNGATRTTTGTGLADDISYPTLPLKVFRGRSTGVANGQVNNVRIWRDIALSPSQVLLEYNFGSTLYTAVESSSLALDMDIENSTYVTSDPTYGTGYLINNKVDDSKSVLYNSEVEDLIDGCPP
jgi:hypothetical protein